MSRACSSSQTQPALSAPPPHFDGATYDALFDGARLGRQLHAVCLLMRDGSWWTHLELKMAGVPGSVTGISARIRDLRKQKFGGYTVERRRRQEHDGLWEFRIVRDVGVSKAQRPG